MPIRRVLSERPGAFYHVMSRVVDRRFIFGPLDRGAPGAVEATHFVRLMRRVERFCGMRIVTWTLMSNHFHILVQEPAESPEGLSDDELCTRYAALYGEPAGHALARERERLVGHGASGLGQWQAMRERLTRRMGTISAFMKELKGRFTMWYNRRHERTGVLWEQRFKSVLIDGSNCRDAHQAGALLTMAAYIDLNAVRAGLVSDPSDYRWCGLGEAVHGRCPGARQGLALAIEGGIERMGPAKKLTWEEIYARYRRILGLGEKDSLSHHLRKRIRYFSDGAILGGRDFIEEWFSRHPGALGPHRRAAAHHLRGADWGSLHVLRDLRKNVTSFS